MANRLTERGLFVLCEWEQFSPIPYKDGDVSSRGFGHSEIGDPHFWDIPVWTREYGMEVLLKDLVVFEAQIKPHIKVKIPDTLYSCILNLCYGKGSGRLHRSDQWKVLHDTSNPLHKEDFCVSILDYALEVPNNVTGILEIRQGLKYRRIAEGGLYLQERHNLTGMN